MSTTSIFAQQHKHDFVRYIFPVVPEFKQGGFFISPGLTYMAPGSSENNLTTSDGFHQFDVRPKGDLRFMLQAGYFHSFKEPYFWDFIEAGLSYKILMGQEEYLGNIDDVNSINSRNSVYEDSYVGAFLRITKITQFSDNFFITNSIGLNGDYLFNESRDPNYRFTENIGPDKQILQAHYQLGFGFRASKRVLVIPTLETPILNLLPFEDFKSTLPYYNSRYRPILITIKVMLLRPDPLNCNAPIYEGKQPTLD